MTNVADLINESIANNTIVTVGYGDYRLLDETEQTELLAALSLESDDNVQGNDRMEYWGTDEDGNEWRVHVANLAPASF
jgi:hypothetical protein